MRTASMLALLAVTACAACASPAASEDESNATDVAAASAEVSAKDRCSAGCTNDGKYALRVSGTGVAARAPIAVAAVEPTFHGEARRVVLTGETRNDGSYALRCDRALGPSDYYPSYGVWVDTNRDGKCGAGDLALVGADFYGWASDLSITTDADGIVPEESWSPEKPWEDAAMATRWGDPFCAYYGFAR